MDSRPSDETLLLAVAERDMGAFRTLYERHAGWLAIRLARRCNDRPGVLPDGAVTVLAAVAGAALTLVARGDLARGDLASNLALSVSVAAYATLGALIVRRAGNAIGWIMLAEGAAQAFLAIASVYAVIGLETFPGSLPATETGGHAGRVQLPRRGLHDRVHVPALPDRDAAVTALAPGGRSRPGAGRPDHGRAGRAPPAGGAPGPRRGLAELPEPAGR